MDKTIPPVGREHENITVFTSIVTRDWISPLYHRFSRISHSTDQCLLWSNTKRTTCIVSGQGSMPHYIRLWVDNNHSEGGIAQNGKAARTIQLEANTWWSLWKLPVWHLNKVLHTKGGENKFHQPSFQMLLVSIEIRIHKPILGESVSHTHWSHLGGANWSGAWSCLWKVLTDGSLPPGQYPQMSQNFRNQSLPAFKMTAQ